MATIVQAPLPARRTDTLRQTLAQQQLMVFLLIVGALPLLWPSIPPLIDLPNHMARYRIGADYAQSPFFRQWFDFHWVLVGNLGVDLAVTALAPALGIEGATKLVVLAIPVLTIAGALSIAREVHGRIPPTTAFAAVFAYNFAFNFGFVNFTLSVALALLAFGLWLRMARTRHVRWRAPLFVPLGFVVWLAHACGWGILGVLILSWEAASARARGAGWSRALLAGSTACLPLTLPLAPMLLWSSRIPQSSLGSFNPDPGRKLGLLFLALRNGMPLVDLASMLAVWGVAMLGILRRDRDFGFDPRLGVVAGALLFVYWLMPDNLMGSGHADLRIAPYALLLVMLALRPTADTRLTRALGIAAILFFAGRMAYQTISYARINLAQEHSLAALDHLPVGARVFGFAQVACSASMEGARMENVNRIAIVRRQAFTNGTWPYPASQTLIVHPAMIAGYADEASQLLHPSECREGKQHTIAGALASLPPGRFEYFWLIDTPQRLWPSRSWLRVVWSNDRTILYRIVGRSKLQPRVGEQRVPARTIPFPA